VHSPVASSVRVVPPSHCNSSNLWNLQVPKTPHVPIDTIQNIRSPSIRVKVRIVCHGRKINAHAILDSGAKGVYCNISFINAYKIPTSLLAKPIYPRNVDGTLNKQGPICHTAILRMEMGEEHKETTEMAITNIGQHDILLGTDWFRAHNPQIDWAKNNLHLNRCPNSCYPNYPNETSDLAHLLPTEDLEAHYDDLLESKYQGIDPTQCILAHLQGEYEDMIQPSELVVSPTMSPPKTSIVVSQHNMATNELVVMPTMLITWRTGLVVTSTVPLKTASWHTSPWHGPVVMSTVPPKKASRHTSPWYEPVVAWTMVSTTLAKAEQPKNVEIPPEFHQYGKVFSDEEAQRLTKHQPWDHKIDLIPGMEMKKTTVYHLTPIEKVALKEYIEDGLKQGTLHWSEAPHTCSFFFIDKKDSKLLSGTHYFMGSKTWLWRGVEGDWSKGAAMRH